MKRWTQSSVPDYFGCHSGAEIVGYHLKGADKKRNLMLEMEGNHRSKGPWSHAGARGAFCFRKDPIVARPEVCLCAQVQERREMTEQRLPDKIAHRKTIKDLRKARLCCSIWLCAT